MYAQSKKLIASWFGRAWDKRDAAGEDAFEPFIYCWFSVNAWAACVTNQDRDAEIMKRLIASEGLITKFNKLHADDAEFAAVADEFAGWWPIFEVKSLRQADIRPPESGSRRDVVDYYLSQSASRFEPQCWQQHGEKRTPVPCDWPHTIAAIYRVQLRRRAG